MSLKYIPDPKAIYRFLLARLRLLRLAFSPNLLGATVYPPGHFYSPLLDLPQLEQNGTHLPFDGAPWWEHIDLRQNEQRAYYEEALQHFPCLPFPRHASGDFRYYTDNRWFRLSDAFTLSSIIRRERPQRIIEAGSGFSSAVMLDTLRHTGATAELTFIEPHPERLHSLLTPVDRAISRTLVQQVQETPLAEFDKLKAQDVLFIDSSHVAKVGSDVTFLLLRVLPRLQPGVLIHLHDVVYPYSYPARWIREGRAWNESLFLRAFLIGNPQFQIMAFNSFAGETFPELFRERLPAFLDHTGGSIWLRKVA